MPEDSPPSYGLPDDLVAIEQAVHFALVELWGVLHEGTNEAISVVSNPSKAIARLKAMLFLNDGKTSALLAELNDAATEFETAPYGCGLCCKVTPIEAVFEFVDVVFGRLRRELGSRTPPDALREINRITSERTFEKEFGTMDIPKAAGDVDRFLWRAWRRRRRNAEQPRRGAAQDRAGAPLTEGQQAVWDALKGRALSGKELAKELDTSTETIRQYVSDLRKARYEVPSRRGRGYYRPDAPPDDSR